MKLIGPSLKVAWKNVSWEGVDFMYFEKIKQLCRNEETFKNEYIFPTTKTYFWNGFGKSNDRLNSYFKNCMKKFC